MKKKLHTRTRWRFAVLRTSVYCLVAQTLCLAQTMHGAGQKFGDATVVRPWNPEWMPAGLDRLAFPQIPIGARATVSYRATNLPQVIYPSHMELEVPEAEALPPHPEPGPWQRCRVRVSLLRLDGVPFFSRMFDLGKQRHGSRSAGRGRRRVVFPLTDYDLNGTTSLPHHLSYELRVEVLQPSGRASDKLSIGALTQLPNEFGTGAMKKRERRRH